MSRSVAAVALGLLLTSIAWSIGWGSLGNEPLKGVNYRDWPNVMRVINDTHRVGHVWVNGNEHFNSRSQLFARSLENCARHVKG